LAGRRDSAALDLAGDFTAATRGFDGRRFADADLGRPAAEQLRAEKAGDLTGVARAFDARRFAGNAILVHPGGQRLRAVAAAFKDTARALHGGRFADDNFEHPVAQRPRPAADAFTGVARALDGGRFEDAILEHPAGQRLRAARAGDFAVATRAFEARRFTEVTRALDAGRFTEATRAFGGVGRFADADLGRPAGERLRAADEARFGVTQPALLFGDLADILRHGAMMSDPRLRDVDCLQTQYMPVIIWRSVVGLIYYLAEFY